MNVTELKCGACVVDITPTVEDGILPMPSGYSASFRELTCVHDPLACRVIALDDGRMQVLLVSMDIVNLDEKLCCPELARRTGIPEKQIFMIETTAHSTIRMGRERRNQSDEEEGKKKQEKYTAIVMERMLQAAQDALARMVPARVGYGTSQSYINTNRDTRFTDDGREFTAISANFAGVSDKTVAVLQFEDYDGKPIAFFVNYPIFNVLMDDNQAGGNGTGAISADIAGYVSTHLERRFPGSVAMWSGGANCDQDPIIKAKLHYPDPDGGGRVTDYLSAESCDVVWKCLGSRNYRDTLDAIEQIKEKEENLRLVVACGETAIPGRRQRIEELEGTNFVRLSYENGEEMRLHLALLRIGDYALVFHGGSLYASIGLYLKEEALLKHTIVVTGYKNTKVAFDGAICDDEGLAHGGHDCDRVKYRPGFAKNALALLMNRLIMETEENDYHAETLRWKRR